MTSQILFSILKYSIVCHINRNKTKLICYDIIPDPGFSLHIKDGEE
jgi:hypothetical protein